MNRLSKELYIIADLAEKLDIDQEGQQEDFNTSKELKKDLSTLKTVGGKRIKQLLNDQAYQRLQSSNPSTKITPSTKLSQLTVDDLQKILACLK